MLLMNDEGVCLSCSSFIKEFDRNEKAKVKRTCSKICVMILALCGHSDMVIIRLYFEYISGNNLYIIGIYR